MKTWQTLVNRVDRLEKQQRRDQIASAMSVTELANHCATLSVPAHAMKAKLEQPLGAGLELGHYYSSNKQKSTPVPRKGVKFEDGTTVTTFVRQVRPLPLCACLAALTRVFCCPCKP